MRNIWLFIVLNALYCLGFADIPKIYSLHINGINTTQIEARTNLQHLQEVANIKSNMIVWSTIWNPTGSDASKTLLDNLRDVIDQKAHEQQATMSLEDFTNYLITKNPAQYPPDVYHPGTLEYAQLEEQSVDLYTQMLKEAAGTNFDYIVDEFHETS